MIEERPSRDLSYTPPPKPICPYCEKKVDLEMRREASIESYYSMAQSEPVVVVICPHCHKILGIVGHDCD